jgi:hypothetical protein
MDGSLTLAAGHGFAVHDGLRHAAGGPAVLPGLE